MALLSPWAGSHSPSFVLLLSGNRPPYQEDTGVIASHPFAHKKSELSSYETSTTQSCSIDSVSFWLQELCVLFWQEAQRVWSLCLAQQELPEELELEEDRVLFPSKLVCNLLWTCSFSPWFVCLCCLFFFFLMVSILTFLRRGLENNHISFSSLGLFRHDDPTQHLGTDFSFTALYKHSAKITNQLWSRKQHNQVLHHF